MESSNLVGYPITSGMFRWKSGEIVDSRLLGLLESLEEMYVKRHEFFEKIFPGNHELLFQKIGDAIMRRKTKKSITRSRSIDSGYAMRGRGLDDGIDASKDERFKVKTPNVIVEDGQSS